MSETEEREKERSLRRGKTDVAKYFMTNNLRYKCKRPRAIFSNVNCSTFPLKFRRFELKNEIICVLQVSYSSRDELFAKSTTTVILKLKLERNYFSVILLNIL